MTLRMLLALLIAAVGLTTPLSAQEELKDKTDEVVSEAKDKVDEWSKKLDESDKAKEVSAGLLSQIYRLAEALSFPAFHAVAFGLMVAGVVSFSLQLVLAKLVVLSRLGLSMTEILSDALGLAISLVGLVLTTQAAAENSNFTQSPAAVLTSAVVGAIVGFVFYLWGQRAEVDAAKGRSVK